MSNERDDLAGVIIQHPWLVDQNRAGWPKGFCPTCNKVIDAGHNSPCHAEHIADAILAAGYRKPRTITTAEELDALPEGAIVVGDWAAFQKVLGAWVMVGGPSRARPELPVLHVWEPQP